MDATATDDFTVETSGMPDAGIIPEPVEAPTPAAPPDPAPPDPAPVEADEATPDAEASAEETAEDRARDEQGRFAKKDKPRDNPIARINQLTAQKADAERKAAELEARLRAIEQDRRPNQAPAERLPVEQLPGLRPMPTEDAIGTKYQSYADFALDLARWVREEERAQEHVAQARASDQRRSQELSVKAAGYVAAVTQARSADPTLDAAYRAVEGIPVTPTIEQAVLLSDNQLALANYLATHPEEFAQLAAESAAETDPVGAAKWMRRYLEAKVSGAAHSGPAPTPPISAAKAPIKPVGSSPSSADPLEITDDLPIEEHIRRMNARERQQRRGL